MLRSPPGCSHGNSRVVTSGSRCPEADRKWVWPRVGLSPGTGEEEVEHMHHHPVCRQVI